MKLNKLLLPEVLQRQVLNTPEVKMYSLTSVSKTHPTWNLQPKWFPPFGRLPSKWSIKNHCQKTWVNFSTSCPTIKMYFQEEEEAII